MARTSEAAVREMVFGAMVVVGVAIMMLDMRSDRTPGWVLSSIYALWMALVAAFVYINKVHARKTTQVLGYLICIVIVLAFLTLGLRMPPDSVPAYIPLSTDIGLFLGLAIKDILGASRGQAQVYGPRILDLICHVLHRIGLGARDLLDRFVQNIPQRTGRHSETRLLEDLEQPHHPIDDIDPHTYRIRNGAAGG